MLDFDSIRKPKENKGFILKNQGLLKVFNVFSSFGTSGLSGLASSSWPEKVKTSVFLMNLKVFLETYNCS